MSDDPTQLAAEVVLDGLREKPELFVAMHYLGLIDGNALQLPSLEQIDPQADRLIVLMDQLEPVHPAPRPLNKVVYDASVWQQNRTRTPRQSSSSFAAWVDGKIAYHPNVLGWPADDPRNWPRQP